MRGRRVNFKVVSAFVAAVVLFAFVACQAPQPVNQPPEVKLVVQPEVVKEGGTYKVSFVASDPEGDELNYELVIDGITIEGKVKPSDLGKTIEASTLVAPSVEEDTYKTITITVKDTAGNKAFDTKQILIKNNRPPIIEILSVPESVYVGEKITVSFKITDEDDETVSYTVSVNGETKDSGEISSGDSVDFEYTPTEATTVKIEITASDGIDTSSKVKEINVVEKPNKAPFVNITYLPESVYKGQSFKLSFQAWDEDGNYPLSYDVYIDDDKVKSGEISETANTVEVDLTAPETVGQHTVKVVVKDSKGAQSSDIKAFMVEEIPPENYPPTVEIKSFEDPVRDKSISGTLKVTDPDDATVTAYYYVYKVGQEAILVASETVETGVVVNFDVSFDYTESGAYYFKVVVEDSAGNKSEDMVIFNFEYNNPPEITSFNVETTELKTGGEYKVDVKIEDPDEGDIFTYTLKLGDSVVSKIQGTTEKSVTMNFQVPNTMETGSYILKLIVEDSYHAAASTQVEVNVVPDEPPTISGTPTFKINGDDFAYEKDTFEMEMGTSASIEVNFTPVDDTEGNINYEIEFLGKKISGTAQSNELVTETIEFNTDDVGSSGKKAFTITLTGANGKTKSETYYINIKLKGVISIRRASTKDVIGKENKFISFIVDYKEADEDNPIDIKYIVKNETLDSSFTGSFGSISLNSFTVGIGNTYDINLNNKLAGKYSIVLYVVSNVDGEATPIAISSSEYFYFYDDDVPDPNLTVSSTNVDLTDNYLKGSEPATFTLVIPLVDGKATTLLLSKEGYLSFESNFNESIAGPELEASDTKEVDDYYWIELPATITFKVDPLLVETSKLEIENPVATATINLPDSTSIEKSVNLKPIDNKEPDLGAFTLVYQDAKTVKIVYKLTDMTDVTATVNFYIKEGDEYTPVATDNLTKTENTVEKPVDLSSVKFDKQMVYYSYEIVDEVGNSTKVEYQPTGDEYDTKFGSIEFSASSAPENRITTDATSYHNSQATELTFTFTLKDNAGVAAENVEITYPSWFDTNASTDLEFTETDEGLVATLKLIVNTNDVTYVFEKNSATIKATDVSGNATTLSFPEATIVIDTSSPNISSFNVDKLGNVTINLTEDYLESVTIKASMSGLGTKTIYTGDSVSGIVLKKEDFEELFGSAPNATDVSFELYVKDKAGNEASKTDTFNLDLVLPALNVTPSDQVLTREATQATGVHVKADSSSSITAFYIMGSENDEFHITVEYPDGSTGEFDGNALVDIPDVNEATLTITLKNGAVLDSGTEATVQIFAKDDTYSEMIVGTFTINLEGMYVKQGDIEQIALVTDNNATYLIARFNAAGVSDFNFEDESGNDEASAAYNAPDMTYVVDLSTDTYAPGKVSFTVNLDNSISITVKNLETWTFDFSSAVPVDQYVPDLLPDKVVTGSDAFGLFGDKYYWKLTDATYVVIEIPAVDGVWWNVANEDTTNWFGTDMPLSIEKNTDGTNTSYATITYDNNGVFDSSKYGLFTGLATVTADVGDGVNLTDIKTDKTLLNIYTGAFMDEYAYTVEVASALANTDATYVIATLTINMPGIGDILDDASFTLSEASVNGVVKTVSGLASDVINISTDTNIATILIEASNNTGVVSGLQDATILINKDDFKLKFKPAGFTNGFWITNFSGSISN